MVITGAFSNSLHLLSAYVHSVLAYVHSVLIRTRQKADTEAFPSVLCGSMSTLSVSITVVC